MGDTDSMNKAEQIQSGLAHLRGLGTVEVSVGADAASTMDDDNRMEALGWHWVDEYECWGILV